MVYTNATSSGSSCIYGQWNNYTENNLVWYQRLIEATYLNQKYVFMKTDT